MNYFGPTGIHYPNERSDIPIMFLPLELENLVCCIILAQGARHQSNMCVNLIDHDNTCTQYNTRQMIT